MPFALHFATSFFAKATPLLSEGSLRGIVRNSSKVIESCTHERTTGTASRRRAQGSARENGEHKSLGEGEVGG